MLQSSGYATCSILHILGRNELLYAHHPVRLFFAKTFNVEASYELRQWRLPWFLLMVGELAKFFRIHAQFSCHLNLSMRKMEPFAYINPYLIFFGYLLP